MTALSQTIEATLAEREPDEIALAYRRICAMMLRHTAMSLRRQAIHCNEDAHSKKAARQWLHRGGIVSFVECCDCLSFPEASARRAIAECADAQVALSMNRAKERCA